MTIVISPQNIIKWHFGSDITTVSRSDKTLHLTITVVVRALRSTCAILDRSLYCLKSYNAYKDSYIMI